MARITGQKAHQARLKRLRSPAMVAAVGKAVYAAADMLRVEARLSITAGSVSGKGHVASLPGEAPNNDEGTLAKGIINEKTGPLSAEVSSNAEHSAPLEFGTSKMAARPFMQPAAAKVREKAGQLVALQVRKVTR